jgi:O-antigen ligase
MDRLTFNLGPSRGGPLVVSGRHHRAGGRRAPAGNAVSAAVAAIRERYDWDYLWMLLFTALLFFRPQDQIPGLEILHLSELTAIAGLAAMAVRRMSAGLTIAHVNVEVIAIVVLGGIIVLTVPFSIWPGGSAHVFTDIYVKIILIFALMMSTITSPRRLRQMTWVMMVASGYIGARAVFDYVRGVNLVEGDRVRGAVGGMFENPNDLALNLVTFLAPTLIVILHDRKPTRRLFACGLAAAMLAAIVCTKSRSGFLGLLATGVVVMYYTVRVNPMAVGAVAVAGLMALPAMPSSFWDRMDSIMNAEEDQTGSRAARLRLIDQGIQVFLENPITGIGAGQFKNYNSPDEVEKWRVTHNVWLQVAAELGIGGLLTFAYLVLRGFTANFAAMRIMRQSRKRAGPISQPVAESDLRLTDEEWRTLDLNAKGMLAAMVGWTICSMFASVAFNWTFYYVLALSVAGRQMLAARRAAVRAAEEAAPIKAAPRSRLIRVHA